MARAPRLFTIGDESHGLIEGVPQLSPESRGFESNRLLAEDATPAMAETLRRRFYEALRDRDGQRPPPDQPVRMLEKTPKNSLRVPFLARVFPEARFIYLYRDPRQVLSSMIEAWTTGRFRTYPQLPGWTGPAWSLLLVPGWRELIGRPLHEIVAAQWNAATRLLIDDLEALPVERRTIARYDALVADPTAQMRRLYAATGLDWDEARNFAPLVEVHGVTARRRQVAAPQRRDRGNPAVACRAGRARRTLRGALIAKKKRRPLARPPPVLLKLENRYQNDTMPRTKIQRPSAS